MKKILIIEDADAIRTELKTLFCANGYQPVDTQPCDLILMDVNLSGESGFTRCRKLRQTSDTPVIFLTARDTPEDELLAFGVGGDDFIRKSYNSAVLLARVGRMMQSRLDVLPEKYLIGETLERPRNAVELEYYLLMKEISRSAIGDVEQARAEKQDYCDYVKSWVHEIKTPLTACSLILSNDGNPVKLRRELRRRTI